MNTTKPRRSNPDSPARVDTDAMTHAHNADVERSLLASCLDGRHPESWSLIRERSDGPAAFWMRDHRLIAMLIDQLAATGKPYDAVSVATAASQTRYSSAVEALRGLDGQDAPRMPWDAAIAYADSLLPELGGQSGIAAILEAPAHWSAHEANVRHLDAYHRQRQIIAILASATDQVRAADGVKKVQAIADQASNQIAKVMGNGRGTETIATGATQALSMHDESAVAGDERSASWGVKALDDGCPLSAGQVVILAARPGCGKTSMMLQVATATRAKLGAEAVALVSLEMGAPELARIIIGRQLGIGRMAIKRGWMTMEQRRAFEQAIVDWSQNDIPVKSAGGKGSIDEVCAWVRGLHRRTRGKLHVVGIDYLGLINGTNPRHNTNERVGEVTRALKLLSLELRICVLLLCQMNRQREGEKTRAPELRDLRDSGNIEQDADAVVFLWSQTEVEQPVVTVNVSVAKARNGPRTTFGVDFLRGYGGTFREIGGGDDRDPRGKRMEREPAMAEDLFDRQTPQQESS